MLVDFVYFFPSKVFVDSLNKLISSKLGYIDGLNIVFL